jgi:hypothetical protein
MERLVQQPIGLVDQPLHTVAALFAGSRRDLRRGKPQMPNRMSYLAFSDGACLRRGYFGYTRKSSKYITESATVQSPTFPAPVYAVSWPSITRRWST